MGWLGNPAPLSCNYVVLLPAKTFVRDFSMSGIEHHGWTLPNMWARTGETGFILTEVSLSHKVAERASDSSEILGNDVSVDFGRLEAVYLRRSQERRHNK